ncbi:hypothetical protein ACRAWD_01735 [Caulobacter segnis]
MTFDLATFAVRRWPKFTLVAFGLLVMLGINAFLNVPRSEDPHFPTPIVIVRAVLPGAEPSEMEQLGRRSDRGRRRRPRQHRQGSSRPVWTGAATARPLHLGRRRRAQGTTQVVREVNAISGQPPRRPA